MVKAGERGADFIPKVFIARGELVAEEVEEREVHLIGAMRVRGGLFLPNASKR